MVFRGLFTVEWEEKRLIKHGRTVLHKLRLRYRPNNVQSAPWCTISLGLRLSYSFLSLFSLPTPSVSFPLPASFLRPDFAPPSRLEKLVKVPIPMSGFLIRQGKDYSNEKEWERQKEGERFMRERREEAARQYQRYERKRAKAKRWELGSMCVTHLAQQESRGRTSRWKIQQDIIPVPWKAFLTHFPSFLQSSTPWKQYCTLAKSHSKCKLIS